MKFLFYLLIQSQEYRRKYEKLIDIVKECADTYVDSSFAGTPQGIQKSDDTLVEPVILCSLLRSTAKANQKLGRCDKRLR